MLLRVLLCLALATFATRASSQVGPEPVPEGIQIGLSTDTIYITSDFSGEDLTIFGALENPNTQVLRQGRYDVVVVLEGPPRPTVVRKKTRVLGMWINTESVAFRDVPASYSVAMTRPPQDITDEASYRQLALRAANIHLQPLAPVENSTTLAEFSEALRSRMAATGMFSERVGGVQFLSQSLFRATLYLAPHVPVGTHRARAFLFKNGAFVKETSTHLTIRKAGLEQRLYEFAQENGLAYGVLAVLLAILTGWLGSIVFRRS
ncbi:TIGR02186 family protein [Chelativorans composti]|uniref:TIGR02186 family protein n=1 Tax=Chelativorans composti TaxID=768533 RepID=A0ABW5DL91_9HYPH